MIGRDQQSDLRRVVEEWVAQHCSPQSVAEAEEFAGQIAEACGAAVVEQLLPSAAERQSDEGCSRPCTCHLTEGDSAASGASASPMPHPSPGQRALAEPAAGRDGGNGG